MFTNDGSVILYDESICWHCGHCAHVCPTGAIESRGGNISIDQTSCVACNACVNDCPASALLLADDFNQMNYPFDF